MLIRYGGFRIPSLLFADDVGLLASSTHDLQCLCLSLGQFAAECEVAAMRISTSPRVESGTGQVDRCSVSSNAGIVLD